MDYGAQYAQLIARRVREADVYSEIVPHTLSTQEILAKNPSAIILSGGPSSVYAEGAPRIERDLFDAGVPVLGICYGFQAMADALGGTVAKTGLREYGSTDVRSDGASRSILTGTPEQQNAWMSHGDSVQAAPDGFDVLARTSKPSGAACTLSPWLIHAFWCSGVPSRMERDAPSEVMSVEPYSLSPVFATVPPRTLAMAWNP